MIVLRTAVVFTLLNLSIAVAADSPGGLSRRQFVDRLVTIEKGMSGDEVRRLLGVPDDVRNMVEAGRTNARWKGQEFGEAWEYGTSGHLTLATLGEVLINTEGKVIADPATKNTPLPPADFDEGEMRKLLHRLDEVTGEREFDPRTVIAAVNALHPLGKEKALQVIEEYTRIGDRNRHFDLHYSMSFVLQALYGYDRYQRLELKIVDDVPFVPGVAGGYSGPGPQAIVFGSCRDVRQQNLPLRAKPLRPIGDLRRIRGDSLALVAGETYVEQARERINGQFARLIASVYKKPIQRVEEGRIVADDASWWQELDDKLASLSVRWDAAASRYVPAPE